MHPFGYELGNVFDLSSFWSRAIAKLIKLYHAEIVSVFYSCYVTCACLASVSPTGSSKSNRSRWFSYRPDRGTDFSGCHILSNIFDEV